MSDHAAQSGLCEQQLTYEDAAREVFNVFVCEREKDHKGPHQSAELMTWTVGPKS